MSAITFREAGEADGDTLWHILRPVFRAGDTYAIDTGISREDALAYWLQERAWIAEDGDPLGTFYIRENQKGGGAHVCNAGFITAPGAEGRGVARAMLAEALNEATALGFHAMQFNFVLETNTRALAIWRRAGFTEIGRQPRAFRTGPRTYIDALILHKFL
ncbi:MAG: GNAT family N-acetyltransferase [Pseudomonadota bacterium]